MLFPVPDPIGELPPPARRGPLVDVAAPVGPPSQFVVAGIGWNSTSLERPPRKPLQPVLAEASLPATTPIVTTPPLAWAPSYPDQLQLRRAAPKPDQVLPVGPAAQIVPLGMGWQPKLTDLQLRGPPVDRSFAVLPPAQPAAAPIFFSAAMGTPLKIARVIYDVVIRPILNFVLPPTPLARGAILRGRADVPSLTGKRDRPAITGRRDVPTLLGQSED